MNPVAAFLKKTALLPLLFLPFFVGCPFNLAHVNFVPASLAPLDGGGSSFVVTEDIKVNPACNFHRIIKKGSTWVLIGNLPEGEVYKPANQILTVECSHVFEAYLVLSGGLLAGYYLPVEKGFLPSSEKLSLPMERKGE